LATSGPQENNLSPIDEGGATPLNSADAKAGTKESPHSFLASVRRNLSEDEASAPGVTRFLLSELEQLGGRCSELEVISSKYNDLRVDNAVLEARVKSSKWHEVLSGLCLAAGSAGIGGSSRFITAADSAQHDTGVVLLVVSTILVLAGIASKVWK
jgi:hypothetical protein